MKAIVEFNLPEDREEYEIFNKASDYHSALFHIASNLKKKVMRQIEAAEDRGMTYNAYDTINLYSEEICRVLDDYKITLE